MWPSSLVIGPQVFPTPVGSKLIGARVGIICYDQRRDPELCKEEETKKGPLLWNDKINGLHARRSSILKAPEDTIPVEISFRQAHRGEIDICVNFVVDGDLTDDIVDTVRSCAFSAMSLLNIQLKDHLVPSLPFQVLKGGGETNVRTAETTVSISVQTRHDVGTDQARSIISDFSEVLQRFPFAQNLIIALELYAAHLSEQQARVRFLLLVIAMEAMTQPARKHDVAQTVIDRWEEEVLAERKLHADSTEEYKSLDALYSELKHRRVDSIRSQVRRLFASCASSPEEAAMLQKRALRVYDKRSTLVHEGQLPDAELTKMEFEARDLLQMLFRNTIKTLESKA